MFSDIMTAATMMNGFEMFDISNFDCDMALELFARGQYMLPVPGNMIPTPASTGNETLLPPHLTLHPRATCIEDFLTFDSKDERFEKVIIKDEVQGIFAVASTQKVQGGEDNKAYLSNSLVYLVDQKDKSEPCVIMSVILTFGDGLGLSNFQKSSHGFPIEVLFQAFKAAVAIAANPEGRAGERRPTPPGKPVLHSEYRNNGEIYDAIMACTDPKRAKSLGSILGMGAGLDYWDKYSGLFLLLVGLTRFHEAGLFRQLKELNTHLATIGMLETFRAIEVTNDKYDKNYSCACTAPVLIEKVLANGGNSNAVNFIAGKPEPVFKDISKVGKDFANKETTGRMTHIATYLVNMAGNVCCGFAARVAPIFLYARV